MSATATDATEYVIRTRFDFRPGLPGLGAIHSRITRMDSIVAGMGTKLARGLAAGIGILGAGFGVGAIARGIVGINNEIANAEVGIASMFNALAHLPWNDALAAARVELKGLRHDAAVGVGELSDYVQGFQRIFAPAGAAGASVSEIRELTKLSIGLAGAGSQSLHLGPRDIVQALTSGVSDSDTPLIVQALATIGVSAEQFRGMGKAKKVDTLLQSMRSYKEGVDAFGRTFDARLATLRDQVKDLARTVTAPIYERWNDQLAIASGWLADHQDRLNDIAERIGPQLVKLYGGVGAAAPGAASGAAALGAGAVGLRGAAAIAGTGPIGILISSIVGAVVGGATLALTAAMRQFPGLTKSIFAWSLQLTAAFSHLGSALSSLATNPLIGLGGAPIAYLVDWMIYGATVFVRFVTMIVEALDGMMRASALSFQSFLALTQGRAGASAGYRAAALNELGRTYDRAQTNFGNLLSTERLFERPNKPDEDGNRPTTDSIINFNGPVNVRIQAERLDDPNVVATSFREALAKAMEHPQLSRRPTRRPKPL